MKHIFIGWTKNTGRKMTTKLIKFLASLPTKYNSSSFISRCQELQNKEKCFFDNEEETWVHALKSGL